jgi:CDP-diacylglycerol--glycerol-3-phosphate 3-phosphatidyltransferase
MTATNSLVLRVPLLLVLLRLLFAPIMVIVGFRYGSEAGQFLATLVVLGVLTDVFDGIIARRLGVATPALRRFDSQTDACFWLATLWTAWLLHPDAIVAEWPKLLALLVVEASIYLLAWLRFRREMSTHSWLSKLWGLALTLAFTRLIAFGVTGWSFDMMVVLGLVSQLEVIAIALLLPRWRNDVPTAWHAWRLRRDR